jgi:hypothetical protein
MQGRKERTFNCPDCGVEVTTLYNRTLRCKECAQKRNAEQKKEAHRRLNEKRRLMRAENTEHSCDHFRDSRENIQMCLNCTRKKCNNCLSMHARSGSKER